MNPKTLYELFLGKVANTPEEEAYRFYNDTTKSWQILSWEQMANKVSSLQNALLKLGLKKGEKVGIALRNSVEWVAIEQASLGLELVVVPLYVDDRAKSMAYIIDHAEISVLFMIDDQHLKRVSDELTKSTNLKQIVILKGSYSDAISLEEFLQKPTSLVQNDAEPTDLATIVYTSGTLGNPKGVMLSHENILSNITAIRGLINLSNSDMFLSILPLAHTFERTAGYYLPMITGARVAFGRSIHQIADDLKEVKPTVVIGVSRVFERLFAKLKTKVSQKSLLAKAIFALTQKLGWKKFELSQNGKTLNKLEAKLFGLLDRILISPIKLQLGGNIRYLVSGGSALSFTTAKGLISLDFTLLQGYGLTEFSPVISVNLPESNKPKSVGITLPNVETKIGKNSELLARGKSLMLGYYKDEKATNEAILDGWLCTGDQVEIVDQHIFITGRIKEIIVLSNAKKVPPSDIELTIKEDTLFEEVVIFGENRPFLGAIVVLSDEEKSYTKKELIRRINSQLSSFPSFVKIRRVVVSAEKWTIENGLMTPTMKPKRNKILEIFESEIEKVYEE